MHNVDFHVRVVHCWSSQSPYRLVSILIIFAAGPSRAGAFGEICPVLGVQPAARLRWNRCLSFGGTLFRAELLGRNRCTGQSSGWSVLTMSCNMTWPCQNLGVCRNGACSCSAGYYGDWCEQRWKDYDPVAWGVCQVCARVCVCVCVWLWCCVCLCVFIFVYMCLYVFMCVCVFMCFCLCVFCWFCWFFCACFYFSRDALLSLEILKGQKI